MAARRKSREFALQALFSIDMLEEHQETCNDQLVQDLCRMMSVPESGRDYFFDLLTGVVTHLKAIDKVIADSSCNWKLSRMSTVDRNVIRIAIYELVYRNDIPHKVAINEAVDIGKKFGSEKSGAFINGILDSVYKDFTERGQKGATHEKETDFPEPG